MQGRDAAASIPPLLSRSETLHLCKLSDAELPCVIRQRGPRYRPSLHPPPHISAPLAAPLPTSFGRTATEAADWAHFPKIALPFGLC